MSINVFNCLVDISLTHKVADFSFFKIGVNHQSDLAIEIHSCYICFHNEKLAKHRLYNMYALYQIDNFIIGNQRRVRSNSLSSRKDTT